jgi:hypothetical protein
MLLFRTAFWLALFIVLLGTNSSAQARLADHTNPADQTLSTEHPIVPSQSS